MLRCYNERVTARIKEEKGEFHGVGIGGLSPGVKFAKGFYEGF